MYAKLVIQILKLWKQFQHQLYKLNSLSVLLLVSYFMEGRDPAQLIYRWNNVLDPRLRKGPWTPEEDQVGGPNPI